MPKDRCLQLVIQGVSVLMTTINKIITHFYMKKRQSSPITGLDRPRGLQEVKVHRVRDNGTGWW